eukprot:scaffold7518_cov150-Amphora_coffeaeformis.AAC.2
MRYHTLGEASLFQNNANTLAKNTLTRRSLLVKASTAAAAAAAGASTTVLLPPAAANAKGPEMDINSGEQFVPKSECPCMELKREPTQEDRNKKKIASKTKGPIQNVYNVRFITYLSRFLLNYDPAAKAWFQECSCAKEEGGGFPSDTELPTDDDASPDVNVRAKIRFAEFAESVLQMDQNSKAYQAIFRKSSSEFLNGGDNNKAYQGVLNLFDLLSARFSTPEQKVQLAILFSMITDHNLQPTEQIERLLREVPLKKSPVPSAIKEDVLVENLRTNAILLLPSSYRPVFSQTTDMYTIPWVLPLAIAADDSSSSSSLAAAQKYRDADPLFGGLGSIPVTRGAQSLDVNQYARLALSGAVCTVLVRTALNPLELVKTKMQLANDAEFNEVVLLQNGPTTTVQQKDAITPGNNDNYHDDDDDDDDGDNILGSNDGATLQSFREVEPPAKSVGTIDMIGGLWKLRGPSALFQGIDITFMASIVFGSFGYGATEFFRRLFAEFVETDSSNTDSGLQLEAALLAASAVACIVMCAAATPFEVLRIRSMASVQPKGWKQVLLEFTVSAFLASMLECIDLYTCKVTSNLLSSILFFQEENRDPSETYTNSTDSEIITIGSVAMHELARLWDAFPKMISRELPFAVVKFIAFDIAAGAIISIIDAKTPLAGQVQVGSGAVGLAVSAIAGAVAGIAGAVVSHPADLILTLTSSSSAGPAKQEGGAADTNDWRSIVQDLIKKDGGLANLFVGLPTRALFFALVLGLQFWLYDYVKNLLQVGSDDLTLVLDVFYALGNNLVKSNS